LAGSAGIRELRYRDLRATFTDNLSCCPNGVDNLPGVLIYYKQMASRVRGLGYPTAIVQEGGYDLESIGKSAVSLLRGFKRNKILAIDFNLDEKKV